MDYSKANPDVDYTKAVNIPALSNVDWAAANPNVDYSKAYYIPALANVDWGQAFQGVGAIIAPAISQLTSGSDSSSDSY